MALLDLSYDPVNFVYLTQLTPRCLLEGFENCSISNLAESCLNVYGASLHGWWERYFKVHSVIIAGQNSKKSCGTYSLFIHSHRLCHLWIIQLFIGSHKEVSAECCSFDLIQKGSKWNFEDVSIEWVPWFQRKFEAALVTEFSWCCCEESFREIWLLLCSKPLYSSSWGRSHQEKKKKICRKDWCEQNSLNRAKARLLMSHRLVIVSLRQEHTL